MNQSRKLLKLAVEKAGGQKKFAAGTGLTQQGVSYLLRSDGRVSAETAVAIDRFTKGEVSKELLRPDLFGEPRRRRQQPGAE